jgi:hypothetical protein
LVYRIFCSSGRSPWIRGQRLLKKTCNITFNG